MRVGDFGFDNILLDKKSYENLYENILIYYDISYKIFMGAKNSVSGYIKKGVLHIVLVINLQESELIHANLYL